MEKDCGAWINLLSHRVKARMDAKFQDLGITGVQSRVIFYILKHCEDGPVFQRDLESAFRLSRSTATGILQLLERNGIIRRESVESDARLKSLVPTQRASELDEQVRACLRETDRMLTRGISDGQLQLFKETAAQMLHTVDECTDAAPAHLKTRPHNNNSAARQRGQGRVARVGGRRVTPRVPPLIGGKALLQ